MLRWPRDGAENPATRRIAFFASFPVNLALFALCAVWALLAAVLPAIVHALGWLLRKILAGLGWLVVGSYDRAARECFPSMYASRRNYDVVQGVDRRGKTRSGVLESSWRSGGASGAEVAALLRFRNDPSCTHLRVRTVEHYGGGQPPPGADILFRGTDPEEGELLKYVIVESPH